MGCGEDIREGYYNIDIRNVSDVNVISDVKNLPFKNESVDEILTYFQ